MSAKMNYVYSQLLEPSTYETDGICGDIPLRRHETPFREDIGAIRAQEDWNRLVAPVKDYKGGLGPHFGIMQLTVPECKPDRLEIISYANELAFLYDDHTELFDQEALDKANDEMQAGFEEGVLNGHISKAHGGLKAMQSILFDEMKAIDEPRAKTAMKVWVEFLAEAAGRQHDANHQTLESYLPYRMMDVGEMFWFGLVTFGLGITIPDEEMATVRRLTRPCWILLALQNDLLSYTKECEAARLKGTGHVVNALYIIMKEHSVDFEKAVEICKAEISKDVEVYKVTVAETQANPEISSDTKLYMEALLWTISGNGVWSLAAPRYIEGLEYNEVQKAMMENGLAKTLSTLEPGVGEDIEQEGELSAYSTYLAAPMMKVKA